MAIAATGLLSGQDRTNCVVTGDVVNCDTLRAPEPPTPTNPLGGVANAYVNGILLRQYLQERDPYYGQQRKQRQQMMEAYWNDIQEARAKGDFNTALARTFEARTIFPRDQFFRDLQKVIQQEAREEQASPTAAAYPHFAEGERLMGEKQYDNALSQYRWALRLAPDNPTIRERIKTAQDAKDAEQETRPATK